MRHLERPAMLGSGYAEQTKGNEVMRKFRGTVLVTALLAAGTATAAQATDLWSGLNYTGTKYYTFHTSYVGDSFNDTASSIDADRPQIYHENLNFSGRNFYSTSDFNDLRSVNYNLGFGESWNDRISSVSWPR
jgi:hypothetical protein